MKVQSTIRMQMVLAGLAAAFLFAGTARAQEIYNTEFNDAPNVVPFVQPSPTQPSEMVNTSMSSAQAVQAASSITTSTQVERAGIGQSKSAKVWVASTLLFSIGLFFFSARTSKSEDLDPRKSIRARSMPLA